jgi:hypothetical protein
MRGQGKRFKPPRVHRPPSDSTSTRHGLDGAILHFTHMRGHGRVGALLGVRRRLFDADEMKSEIVDRLVIGRRESLFASCGEALTTFA